MLVKKQGERMHIFCVERVHSHYLNSGSDRSCEKKETSAFLPFIYI